MTANGESQAPGRCRVAKTGSPHERALRHVRSTGAEAGPPVAARLRLAVAQTAVSRTICARPPWLRWRGGACRDASGTRWGAHGWCTSPRRNGLPAQRIMSVDGPYTVGPADWSRCRWDVLRQELGKRGHAWHASFGCGPYLGCVHRLTPPHRPHNSLYVISDRGRVVTRYDERMLSMTKVKSTYTPGTSPVTFDSHGLRLGCALGMECHFPELCEVPTPRRRCRRLSPPGLVAPSALQAQAHAAANSYWVSYSASTMTSPPPCDRSRTETGGPAAAARRRWPSSVLIGRAQPGPSAPHRPVPAATTPTGSTTIAAARTGAASAYRPQEKRNTGPCAGKGRTARLDQRKASDPALSRTRFIEASVMTRTGAVFREVWRRPRSRSMPGCRTCRSAPADRHPALAMSNGWHRAVVVCLGVNNITRTASTSRVTARPRWRRALSQGAAGPSSRWCRGRRRRSGSALSPSGRRQPARPTSGVADWRRARPGVGAAAFHLARSDRRTSAPVRRPRAPGAPSGRGSPPRALAASRPRPCPRWESMPSARQRR